MEKQKKEFPGLLAIALALALLLMLFGCSSPTPPTPSVPTPPTPPTAGCTDQPCFVAAANACQQNTFSASDEVASFQFASYSNCTMVKTLVKLSDNESAQMKALLENKSMTCIYAKGAFDSRLMTSLIFGSENCQGPLKDAMGELLLFTN